MRREKIEYFKNFEEYEIMIRATGLQPGLIRIDRPVISL